MLPRCDQCGMHMSAARLFKHRLTDICNKATERRIRWRDVEIVERCGDMEFRLYGGEGGNMLERVSTFKYLGRPLYRTDDDWPTIRRNIMRTRTVWGRLGKLVLREGAYPRVLEMFYRTVAQTVQLFGLKTWLLSAAM